MATQSFDEDLIVDTPEKAKKIVDAIKKANLEGPKQYSRIYYDSLEESDRILLGGNTA